MNTIQGIDREIQAAMEAARQTHEYRAEGASIEFTEKILAQMEAKGINRAALAKKIGANPAYITKILRGDTNFTLDTMVKIAHALDCEFRSHLQPDGAKTQWFGVHTKTGRMTFRADSMDEDKIAHGTFVIVDQQRHAA
jgi:transcriptional regulator with XRE-family HTH domain